LENKTKWLVNNLLEKESTEKLTIKIALFLRMANERMRS
jgi:hypothetical protein